MTLPSSGADRSWPVQIVKKVDYHWICLLWVITSQKNGGDTILDEIILDFWYENEFHGKIWNSHSLFCHILKRDMRYNQNLGPITCLLTFFCSFYIKMKISIDKHPFSRFEQNVLICAVISCATIWRLSNFDFRVYPYN